MPKYTNVPKVFATIECICGYCESSMIQEDFVIINENQCQKIFECENKNCNHPSVIIRYEKLKGGE